MVLRTDWVANDPASLSAGLNTISTAINRAVEGTGWRDVSGLLLNGWTAEICKVRKRGAEVDVFFDLNGTAATSSTIFNLGVDWSADRSAGAFYSLPSFLGTGAVASASLRVTSAGQFSSADRSANLRTMISFPSNATWPSTLPGVPAA